ncbi:MAG: hypothetical protein B9S32_10470 [Verrucomicrobia bacterium Tous-C9LFEB]|nr:MAG: hypothetical protein B9S32_10470 [Verrucomicrobia bacterium Tous-C9LFEB]
MPVVCPMEIPVPRLESNRPRSRHDPENGDVWRGLALESQKINSLTCIKEFSASNATVGL